MPTVAIVEDHLLLAETLRVALGQDGVTACIVPPDSPDALVPALLAVAADLVLLDLDLAEHGDSTPVIAPLVGAGTRVLVVTGTTDRMRIAGALEAGALGYHAKSAGFGALVARRGRRFRPPARSTRRTVRGVLAKLDVGSQLAAVAAARQAGWL